MIPRETINKAIDYILLHLTAQIKEIYAAYQNMYNVWFPKDGAKEKLLARKLFSRTNLLVFIAGAATVVLVGFGSGWYSRIFVSDAEVQQMIKSGILIFMWDFVLCGLNAIASFYFTSIGKAKESAVISSARGLVILIAAIFVLPAILGMNGVWLASPATEILTLVITLFYLKKDRKEIDDAKQAEYL